MGHEQGPGDTGQRSGQGRNDDEGIEPGLEVNNHQEIDQDNCGQKAEEHFSQGLVHDFGLAFDFNHRTRGHLPFHLVRDLLDICQDFAERPSFCGHIDVDQRHNIPVRDRSRRADRF